MVNVVHRHHAGRLGSFCSAVELFCIILISTIDVKANDSTNTTTRSVAHLSIVESSTLLNNVLANEINTNFVADELVTNIKTNNSSLLRSTMADNMVTYSDSCSSATTCENCTALSRWYSGCHWCSHDQTCHTTGSFYGCAFGASCGVPDPPIPPGESNSSCYSQKTCRDCGLLSSTCHWCGHDNACHVIGSVSGCLTGVDCYNNDRCQRKQPEPLPPSSNRMHMPHGVASIPLIILFVLAGLVVCCATMCCCVAGGVKGAYDELADLATNSSSSNPTDIDIMNDTSSISTPLISNTSTAATVPLASLDTETESDLTQQLLSSEGEEPTEEDHLLAEEAQTSTIVQTNAVGSTGGAIQSIHPYNRRKVPKSMNRLYSACVFCYFTVVLVAVTISFASVRYFPQAPVYSICNDNIAWKSLIDSLTSMKVTADFEILASISNPNHMDVAIDMGQGSFTHNNAFVGTYDIPPTIVAANAITDVLIVAHLMPDKWDALSLTAEYYRGNLVLHVDASVTVRIPVLLNYTFSVKTSMPVNVNEQSDRSLCACPTWNDPTPNTTKPTLLLPDFVAEKRSILL
jgi:hypothetical protein